MSLNRGKTFDVDTTKKTKRLFREKIFVHQKSYYTTLLENDHLRSIYYIVVSIFVIMCLDTITSDLLIYGKHIPTIGLHYALKFWIQMFRNLKQHTASQRFWNYSLIIAFAGFQFYLIYHASRTCIVHDLPSATSATLLLETLRLAMKTYAYIRTNVSKTLTNDAYVLAPLSSYVYFIFAPTLIYRDCYPRTNKINWPFAIKNLVEVILSIVLIAVLFERSVLPIIQDIGLKPITLVELVHGYFSLIMPSALIYFIFHRMILHSWLNFAGEILCFGDRMYHSDWWTSTDYRHYYRSWNTVVHEWLYEFIYKDSIIYVFKHSSIWNTLTVFYLSAIMHEFVCVIVLKMFYPVLFFMFGGIGVLFMFYPKNLSKRMGNIFVSLTLQIGFAFIVYMYGLEYYARTNTTQIHQMSFMEQLSYYPVSWQIFRQNRS